jgi:hypothetical protein
LLVKILDSCWATNHGPALAPRSQMTSARCYRYTYRGANLFQLLGQKRKWLTRVMMVIDPKVTCFTRGLRGTNLIRPQIIVSPLLPKIPKNVLNRG